MNWILHTIAELFSRAFSLMRRTRWSRQWQEEVYESTGNKDDLLQTLREHGGKREREVYVIGRQASSDGIGWEQEKVDFITEDLVQTHVDYKEVRRCGCGSILGFGNNLLGTCAICLAIVCSKEGCAVRCEKCGALVCRRHGVTIRKHTYCSRHRLHGFWLLFWGVLE